MTLLSKLRFRSLLRLWTTAEQAARDEDELRRAGTPSRRWRNLGHGQRRAPNVETYESGARVLS